MSNTKNNAPSMIAYQVDQVGENSFFHRVGAAWKNKAGGYQIKLSAIPVNGEIVLLPPKEKEGEKEAEAK